MIEIIKDAQFSHLKSIGHAFFTRKGGVSEGYYHSLNCCLVSQDNSEHITENRRRAAHHLNMPLDSLITTKNVHGSKVAVVDTEWQKDLPYEADAMVTQLKGMVLASDSADCPIVLFADEQAQVIGLAHAGWRGAMQGVIEETVKTMVLLGANQQNICAVISPCITQDSYEVSNEFYEQFLLMNANNKCYFNYSKKPEHFMFDLLNFVKDKLSALSLKLTTAISLDTYTNEELFFSCRRSFHRKQYDFGGHLSCIYINT